MKKKNKKTKKNRVVLGRFWFGFGGGWLREIQRGRDMEMRERIYIDGTEERDRLALSYFIM